MKSFLAKYKTVILFVSVGIILGATGGFLYWKYVGCISGTCPIWSKPVSSVLYGSALGGSILAAIVPGPSEKK